MVTRAIGAHVSRGHRRQRETAAPRQGATASRRPRWPWFPTEITPGTYVGPTEYLPLKTPAWRGQR